jgi:hypothetical protein
MSPGGLEELEESLVRSVIFRSSSPKSNPKKWLLLNAYGLASNEEMDLDFN